jgi:hypothetical protein
MFHLNSEHSSVSAHRTPTRILGDYVISGQSVHRSYLCKQRDVRLGQMINQQPASVVLLRGSGETLIRLTCLRRLCSFTESGPAVRDYFCGSREKGSDDLMLRSSPCHPQRVRRASLPWILTQSLKPAPAAESTPTDMVMYRPGPRADATHPRLRSTTPLRRWGWNCPSLGTSRGRAQM